MSHIDTHGYCILLQFSMPTQLLEVLILLYEIKE